MNLSILAKTNISLKLKLNNRKIAEKNPSEIFQKLN